MIDIRTKYKDEVVKKMMSQFGYRNALQVPRIQKVVVNAGIGRIMVNTPQAEEKLLPLLVQDLARITSHKPAVTRSRKSISSFKLRQGQIIGLKVTLRGARMYDFLDRLIHVALPRVRDFRGIPARSFDERGNLTIGIREYTVFPEVIIETVRVVIPIEITVVTNAKKAEEAKALFQLLGFPIEKVSEKRPARHK